MLEKWGLDKASPVGTIDIEAYDEDEILPEPEIKDVRSAQRMSGGLIWLSGRTRPDLAFSVSRVSSQSTIRPLWALRLGKRVLRYLLGTRHHVLRYKPSKSGVWSSEPLAIPFLDVYADASFEPTRAQSGMAAYLASMLIDWRSTKQAQPPRSTGEAELTTLATANLSLEGTEALLHSMKVVVTSRMFGDNEASIAMSHGQHSWRTRALCNRSGSLKARIHDGTLTLSHCSTSDMKADGLTKFLSVPLMNASRKNLCLMKV